MADTNTEDNNYAVPPHVSGAMNQHTPPFWRLALPALGVRYIGQYFEPLIQKATGKSYHRHFDAAAGAWMVGVTGLFAYTTMRDMKNVFAETIAYETGKNPADVGYMDLFKSDNKCVVKACRNILTYNAMRTLANATFFTSFLSPIIPQKWQKLKTAVEETPSTNLGVGANSAYLFGEIVFRNRTFFEHLQNFIDSNLNQKNAMGEDIHPIDLLHLYERNAIDNDPGNAFRGQVSSAMWKESQIIFERMTDLMNHTYQDKRNGKKSENFTLAKFLYMLGNNLVQPRQVEQTLAYVEVANSYGIDALRKVAGKVKNGETLAGALAGYNVSIPTWQQEKPPEGITEFAPKGRKFVESVPTRQDAPKDKSEASFTKRYSDKSKDHGNGFTVPS